MGRSKWKGPYINVKNLETLKEFKKHYAKTAISRNTTILPQFIEQTLPVHNGKKFVEILVTEEMIGHKFGEFSATRKRFYFKKTKTKNR